MSCRKRLLQYHAQFGITTNMAHTKLSYKPTATSTLTNFAAASETDSVVSLLCKGPAFGTVVEFTLWEKVDPGDPASPLERIVMNSPTYQYLSRGVSLADGWYVTHQKLSGPDAQVQLKVAGTV